MKTVVVIGGGILGLSVAYRLISLNPEIKLVVLEKEHKLAAHQTGNNSGVLHSGIYYKPGSHKAINCRNGKALMESFCDEHDIPYEICGKVIVAVDEREKAGLERIYQRGRENGVDCTLISKSELQEIEPHVNGISAVRVKEAGIVDYVQVSLKLSELLQEKAAEIRLNTKVIGIDEREQESVIKTSQGDFPCDAFINCAGLYSDKIASMNNLDPQLKIVPFRGEYFELTDEATHLCKNLIYPVPDPEFPFLGVHFTRMINGGVECGPNAVLGLAREGYSWKNVNLPELFETLGYPGFQKLALSHWKMGLGEIYRSISKKAFVSALQRLVPEIQAHHLLPAHAGVRAQAVSIDGKTVDDFVFIHSKRSLHVCNAPSPGATASLSIGQSIVKEMLRK